MTDLPNDEIRDITYRVEYRRKGDPSGRWRLWEDFLPDEIEAYRSVRVLMDALDLEEIRILSAILKVQYMQRFANKIA